MANTVIGTLLIALKAETTAFSKGMNDAKRLAFDSSDAIVESIGKIGEKLNKLNFDNLKNAGKSLGLLGGIAAGAGIAVGGAMLEMAKSTAENVKQMEKMAQSYGLSIEQVSAMRVASKMTGVEMDVLAMGMGRLAKAAAKVVESGQETGGAFATLGIKVTAGHDKLKPLPTLQEEIADKFSKMQNGTAKTALAMELFGRGGAALIPFLNRGKEGIRELNELSEKLGLTWTEKDAVAAEQLAHAVEIQELKMTALKEQMVRGLLPALDKLADEYVKVGKDGTSLANSIGSDFGTGLIYVGNIVDSLVTSLKILSIEIKGTASDTADFFGSLKNATLHPTQAGAIMLEYMQRGKSQQQQDKIDEDRLNAEWKKRYEDSHKPWVAPKVQDGKGDGKNNPKIDTAEAGNVILDRISKLKAEAESESKVAASLGETTSARILAKAAAEAEKTIAELNIEGKKKHIHVTDAQAESIKRLTLAIASYKEAIGANKAFSDEIIKVRESAQAHLALADAYGKDGAAVKAAEESAKVAPFEKQSSDLEETIAALKKLGATDKDIEPLQKALAQLTNRLAELRKAVHEEELAQEALANSQWSESLDRQITSLYAYADAVRGGTTALRAYNIEQQVEQFRHDNPNVSPAEIDDRRTQLQTNVDQQELNALADKSRALRQASREIELLMAAQGRGTEAEIQAIAQIDAENYAIEHNIDLKDERIKKLQGEIAANLRLADAQRAAKELGEKYNPKIAYQRRLDEIQKAQDAHAINPDNGITPEQANLARQQADIQLQQDVETIQMMKRTAAGGMHAFFTEFSRDAENAASVVHAALTDLMNGVNDALTNLIMGKKADWKKLFESLGSDLIHAGLKKEESQLFKALGLAKRDGSSASTALYVQDVSGSGGSQNGPAGAAGSALSHIPIIGKLFGGLFGGGANASPSGPNVQHVWVDNPSLNASSSSGGLSSLFGGGDGGDSGGDSGDGSGGGGFLASIGKVLGFADGGDPPRDRVSIVGERGPELFHPHGTAGTIIPNHKIGSFLGAAHQGIKNAVGNMQSQMALPSMFPQQLAFAGVGNVRSMVMPTPNVSQSSVRNDSYSSTYNIDARGTNAADVEYRVRQATAQAQQQSVQTAVMAQREMARRRPSGSQR